MIKRPNGAFNMLDTIHIYQLWYANKSKWSYRSFDSQFD